MSSRARTIANFGDGLVADDIPTLSAAQLNVVGNGTSGQSLVSDGDGSFTWTTPSSGPVYLGTFLIAKRPYYRATMTVPSTAAGYTKTLFEFIATPAAAPTLSSWGFDGDVGNITYSNFKYATSTLIGGTTSNNTGTINAFNTTDFSNAITAGSGNSVGTLLSTGGTSYGATFLLSETLTSSSTFGIKNYSTGSSNQTSYIRMKLWGIEQ